MCIHFFSPYFPPFWHQNEAKRWSKSNTHTVFFRPIAIETFGISEGFGVRGHFSSGTYLLPKGQMVWNMDEKKIFFDQQTLCQAPNCLSKYTTPTPSYRVFCHSFFPQCFLMLKLCRLILAVQPACTETGLVWKSLPFGTSSLQYGPFNSFMSFGLTSQFDVHFFGQFQHFETIFLNYLFVNQEGCNIELNSLC